MVFNATFTSSMSRELTASLLVAIDMIHSLVLTHYICNGYKYEKKMIIAILSSC
jgi:hypothetical protein